jgi:proteasome beta subunit
VDEHGPSVYSVDALGGSTKEEEIVSTGSGSPMAYGVLEDRFKTGLKEDEAIDLTIRGLIAAMKRDAGSGEGIHVVVITKDKYQELGEDKLKQYLAKTHI